MTDNNSAAQTSALQQMAFERDYLKMGIKGLRPLARTRRIVNLQPILSGDKTTESSMKMNFRIEEKNALLIGLTGFATPAQINAPAHDAVLTMWEQLFVASQINHVSETLNRGIGYLKFCQVQIQQSAWKINDQPSLAPQIIGTAKDIMVMPPPMQIGNKDIEVSVSWNDYIPPLDDILIYDKQFDTERLVVSGLNVEITLWTAIDEVRA